MLNTTELRAQARQLTRKEPGLSYSQALHRLARAAGYRSWGALLAATRAQTPQRAPHQPSRFWARTTQLCLAHWLREQAGEADPHGGEHPAILQLSEPLARALRAEATPILRAEARHQRAAPALDARITRVRGRELNAGGRAADRKTADLNAEERAWLRAGGVLQALQPRKWSVPITLEEARHTPPGHWTVTGLPERAWRRFKATVPPSC